MTNYNMVKQNLFDFKNDDKQLKIIARKIPKNSEIFFNKVYKCLNSVSGFVKYDNSKQDIQKFLDKIITKDIKCDPFYRVWIDDMSNLCKLFCKFIGDNKISFWVGTERGCKRYHVDMVPFRLLVTYAGQGTELLPDYAANRSAFRDGKSNKEILKSKSALEYINKWDIAIFRGGEDSILHRTPDSALESKSSILMRLDNPSLLDVIKNNNQVA
ncbi:MAG: hypothetical protein CMP38_04400 [Rickettsiales bacterium]|nr:hypothetical protein [Rickettsiales bacterium]